MQSAIGFARNLNGKMPESAEEYYWSYGYLNPSEGLPGSQISYGFYSGLHGDDYYDGGWDTPNATEVYVISGRDILLVSADYTREQIEKLIQMERNEPVDDLGSLGWTEEDEGHSTNHLAQNHNISHAELDEMVADTSFLPMSGLVENLTVRAGDCPWNWVPDEWRVCVTPHPLELTKPPLVRTTLLRLKDQPLGRIFRRVERDRRPRGHERKLIKHHLHTKYWKWYSFPPFDITDDLVLRMQSNGNEVFRMGPNRDETLFYRRQGEESIG
jgi:hypothetical protein